MGNRFMVIAFITGLALVGVAMFYASFGHRTSPESLTAALAGIPASMGACAPGDHCILVDKSCGQCCDNIAINGRYESQFNKLFAQSCSNFMGKVCRCTTLDSYPACIGGRCQLVPLAKSK